MVLPHEERGQQTGSGPYVCPSMLSPTCWNLHVDASRYYLEGDVGFLQLFLRCQQDSPDGLDALSHTGRSSDLPGISPEWRRVEVICVNYMAKVMNGLCGSNDNS